MENVPESVENLIKRTIILDEKELKLVGGKGTGESAIALYNIRNASNNSLSIEDINGNIQKSAKLDADANLTVMVGTQEVAIPKDTSLYNELILDTNTLLKVSNVIDNGVLTETAIESIKTEGIQEVQKVVEAVNSILEGVNKEISKEDLLRDHITKLALDKDPIIQASYDIVRTIIDNCK